MRITLNLYLPRFAGANHTTPIVTCHNDHTVDINITNVDDLAWWTEAEWQLQNNISCRPTFHNNRTVTYDGLALPDCAMDSQELSSGIKYILRIRAKKADPGGTGQLNVYDHLYYVSCEYGNQNKTTASFVPVKNRQDNDSSM